MTPHTQDIIKWGKNQQNRPSPQFTSPTLTSPHLLAHNQLVQDFPRGVSGSRGGLVTACGGGGLGEGAGLVIRVTHTRHHWNMPRVPHSWPTQLAQAHQRAGKVTHAAILVQETTCLEDNKWEM